MLERYHSAATRFQKRTKAEQGIEPVPLPRVVGDSLEFKEIASIAVGARACQSNPRNGKLVSKCGFRLIPVSEL